MCVQGDFLLLKQLGPNTFLVEETGPTALDKASPRRLPNTPPSRAGQVSRTTSSSRARCVVKRIDVRSLKALARELREVVQEGHPNVVSIRSAFFDVHPSRLSLESPRFVYLQTRYCELGDLHTYLSKRRSRFPDSYAAGIPHLAKGVLQALVFLHEHGKVPPQGHLLRCGAC